MFKKNKFFLLVFFCSILISEEFKFENIPIQESGRIKPLDTYARNQLLRLYGKSSYELSNGNNAIAFCTSHS